jgi:hypothetical protein
MGSDLSKGATAAGVRSGVETLGVAYKPYGILVVDNGIDGNMLPALTDEEMDELGVTSSLHKRRVLTEIAIFVGAGGSFGGEAPSAPTSPVIADLKKVVL